MKLRVERIQTLFKERFGLPLTEPELYGYLRPRLIKYMDEFLDKEISDKEMVELTDFLTQKLHGKSILPEKDTAASPNKNKDLEESPQVKVPPSGALKKAREELKKTKR